MRYRISNAVKPGKQLTPAQRMSSHFAEEPIVAGKVLRRGLPPMILDEEIFGRNELRLKNLLLAEAIEVHIEIDGEWVPLAPDFQRSPPPLADLIPEAPVVEVVAPAVEVPVAEPQVETPVEPQPEDPVEAVPAVEEAPAPVEVAQEPLEETPAVVEQAAAPAAPAPEADTPKARRAARRN